jgi:acyl-CoA thioester hydrolase
MSVKSHSITIVPRYSETDRGGVVHHSVYAVWFELGRTELLRANGTAYSDLEPAGVCFVVKELRINYLGPARYDERLVLETTQSAARACSIEHTYRLTRDCDGALLAEGTSILACVDAEGRLRRLPESLAAGSG